MAKKSKAATVRDEMAAGTLKALMFLGDSDSHGLERGNKADTWMTGAGFPAAQARKLEGLGCVKVVGQQKIGRGYRLECKMTAFGRRVAAAV
jgi:hypothetical protein